MISIFLKNSCEDHDSLKDTQYITQLQKCVWVILHPLIYNCLNDKHSTAEDLRTLMPSKISKQDKLQYENRGMLFNQSQTSLRACLCGANQTLSDGGFQIGRINRQKATVVPTSNLWFKYKTSGTNWKQTNCCREKTYMLCDEHTVKHTLCVLLTFDACRCHRW